MHLCNILSNLLENAVKYSGDSVHITITGASDGHRFTLTVADNGIGIPPAEQARVFDKFYRSASLPDRSVPGIGLGLSYVKPRHRPGPELREAARGSAWRHRRPAEPAGAGDNGDRHYTSMNG